MTEIDRIKSVTTFTYRADQMLAYYIPSTKASSILIVLLYQYWNIIEVHIFN